MELMKRGWLVFKRRWPLLLGCIALGLVGVVVYDAIVGREYTASTSVFLRAPDVKSSASAYQGNLFTMQRANTYVKMVESDDLAQRVVDRLALDTSAHDLAKKVKASPVADTVIIDIAATDDSRQQAANIANTYALEFADYVARVEAVNLTPDVPPLVTTIQPASADDATSNSWAMWILLSLGAGIGLLVGLLLTWLIEHYDTKIRSRRQIETATDSRVIGSLPNASRLRDSESVDDVFESSEKFADAARVTGINLEQGLREITKVNGSSVVTVASVDGGDGKSVVARAAAKSLTERGRKVGLLQVNPESGSANGKVPNTDGIEIKLLRVNGAPIDQAIGAAIDELSAGNDFIIVDPHSAGASAELQVVATLSDAAVIVVRPGHTDQNSLTDLVDALSMLETPVVGVVTNRAKETNTAARYYA